MRRELPAWIAGLALGVCSGILLWAAIDVAIRDTSGIGAALSTGLAIAVTHLRTTTLTKRRAWRDAEAIAQSPSHYPLDARQV